MFSFRRIDCISCNAIRTGGAVAKVPLFLIRMKKERQAQSSTFFFFGGCSDTVTVPKEYEKMELRIAIIDRVEKRHFSQNMRRKKAESAVFSLKVAPNNNLVKLKRAENGEK